MSKNIFQSDHTKIPLIFELIKNHQNDEAIGYLEQHPEEVNLKGWMDHTPLHKAAECGNFELTKYLIGKNADINAQRSGVYATPLCWAKTLEIAILLLESGATMNDRELDMATRNDRSEIIHELLNRGAKIDLKEPQFLNCHSVESLDIYLKHDVDISLTDKNKSSILHSMAWADNVELFEHAFKNGAVWSKDSSARTPYVLAQQGNRTKIIEHLRQNYPELTSHQIKEIDTPELLPFEQLFFFLENPRVKDEIVAITKSSTIVRYELRGTAYRAVQAINIDLPIIRNFTFDQSNNIIVPTYDNKLLKIDSETLNLIEQINFIEARLDQITFLPQKKIYLSSDGWTSYILDIDFKVQSKHPMNDGVFFPLYNSSESLVSTFSYDQETYHSIYTLSDKNELKFIHTFFIDWNNSSEGFGFNKTGDKFAISYPKSLSLCEMSGEEVMTLWTIDISQYPSEHDLSDVVFTDDDLIVLGKGKKIVLYTSSGQLLNETNLSLASEIRELKLSASGDFIIVRTHSEIIPVLTEKIKRA